jgi:glycosyltransferase involved in cell wall biosynthesis
MTEKHSVAILLPDLRGGGAERVATNLANAFVRRGFVVDVILLSKTGPFLRDLSADIEVVDLRVPRFRYAIFPLVRYLRRRRPDALLAFMWPITVLSIWAAKIAQAKTRVVVVEHTTWSRDEIARSFFGRLAVKITMYLSFPAANTVVAVSRGAADDLSRFARLDRSAIHVIYNPIVGMVQPFDDRPCAPDTWWLGAHYRILAVGALKPIKDYATLLTALRYLRNRLDARLLILGEGGCRYALETQARDLDLERFVFMPGFEKNLTPYYRRADLLVLSSIGEGFGNVLVESLEAGTPVVSTDCQSGPREILLNEMYGRLVPVSDPVALALAMEKSLTTQHSQVFLKDRARDFTIERAANEYLKKLFPRMNQYE